jgi:hypothetical protein
VKKAPCSVHELIDQFYSLADSLVVNVTAVLTQATIATIAVTAVVDIAAALCVPIPGSEHGQRESEQQMQGHDC